jgi:hypothetical protein
MTGSCEHSTEQEEIYKNREFPNHLNDNKILEELKILSSGIQCLVDL